jgi:hypothetical protein
MHRFANTSIAPALNTASTQPPSGALPATGLHNGCEVPAELCRELSGQTVQGRQREPGAQPCGLSGGGDRDRERPLEVLALPLLEVGGKFDRDPFRYALHDHGRVDWRRMVPDGHVDREYVWGVWQR